MKRGLSVVLAAVIAVFASSGAWACACGCGVFDVQTGAMLPTRSGGTVFFEYDAMDQSRNWSGSHWAAAENNDDKDIRTAFYTLGGRYMIDRSWGAQIEAPYWSRRMDMADVSGEVMRSEHSSVGDVRLRGLYTGFSSDMSSGVTFGAKLPTGDLKTPGFDRDTQIGTGSTDLLLGAYRMGRIDAAGRWASFVNAQWDEPVLIAAGYRPGAEVDAAAGVYFDDWSPLGVKVVPIVQAVGTVRWRDAGSAARSEDSGYRRLALSPGLEFAAGALKVDVGVAFPVYQDVNGNQLVASRFDKVAVSWSF